MIKTTKKDYQILKDMSASLEKEETKTFLENFKGDGKIYYDDEIHKFVTYSKERLGWLTEVLNINSDGQYVEYNSNMAFYEINKFISSIYEKLVKDPDSIQDEYIEKGYFINDYSYYRKSQNDINSIASIKFQLDIIGIPKEYFNVSYYYNHIRTFLLNKSLVKEDILIKNAFALDHDCLDKEYIDGLISLNNKNYNIKKLIQEQVANLFNSIKKSETDRYIANKELHPLVIKEINNRFNYLSNKIYGYFPKQYTNGIEIYRIVNNVNNNNYYADSMYMFTKNNLDSDVKINKSYINKFNYLMINLTVYNEIEKNESSKPIIFTEQTYSDLNNLIDYFVKHNKTIYITKNTIKIVEALINLYQIIPGEDNKSQLISLLNLRDKISTLIREKKINDVNLNQISDKIKYFA